MKLMCRDCKFGIPIKNKSLKICPQCGSDNLEFSSDNSIETQKTEVKSTDKLNPTIQSRNWVKFECDDCRFGFMIRDNNLKICPQCGSDNTNILTEYDKKNVKGYQTIPSTLKTIGSGVECCYFVFIFIISISLIMIFFLLS